MQRAQRKLEHIKYALELGDGPESTHLEDIHFLHKCLPEVNPADIDLSVEIFGKHLRLPFLIDAITGGTDSVTEINEKIAKTAHKAGIAMAVGSQYGAVKDGNGSASYNVIRKYNPYGVVFANMSALATPEQAKTAVDMLNADALEIHLNAAQELIMMEGDKDFNGLLDNMLKIREGIDVPVIIKETGCGIAAEEYQKLLDEGFAFFDCAGAGGTNFPAIEARRANLTLEHDFSVWGIPTCWSMIDGAVCCNDQNVLIASGGIRTAGQAAKAFALGADIVGITGIVLNMIINSNVDAVVNFFDSISSKLEDYMLLLGCKTPQDLRKLPLIFTGDTKDFITCRGYNISDLSKKRR